MTHIQKQARRPGYTLLEVLLAASISLLLLGALYAALNIQLRNSSAGRDAVETASVARAVFDKFTNDIITHLGPIDPLRLKKSKSSQSGGNPSSGSSPPTGTSPTGGGQTGRAAAGTTPTNSSSATAG